MEFKELSIEEESKRFLNHLEIDDNSRLIFSGIFGIGKTYFLNKFFAKKKDEYETIRINPVNYSVSQNSDIFELVKFDIGYQLFSKDLSFEKFEIDAKVASEYYLLHNYKEIIHLLISNLSKIDRRIDGIVSTVTLLNKKIEEYKDDIGKNEQKELIAFLKNFTENTGTHREENTITELLSKLIESLKKKSPKKKTVLIIDDLDRIDPEHIFRILNVFSAHMDFQDNLDENKFGFDKIILVCDINNVRGIFHSKYGSDIDFSGYIDKFYTHEVFEYSYTKVISESLDKFFKSVKVSGENKSQITFENSNGYLVSELKFILMHLIEGHCLSMRSLINFLKSELHITDSSIKVDKFGSHIINSNYTDIFLIFKILSKIMNGGHNLLLALDKLIKYKPLIQFFDRRTYSNISLGNLVMIVDFKNSNLFPTSQKYIYKNEALDISISYKIDYNSGKLGVLGEVMRVTDFEDDIETTNLDYNESYTVSQIPYFQIFKNAFVNSQFIGEELK
ncbi:KAP-like P-loop domain-containing protein [Maribacter caenipelagi]|uniref:KAP-like P-loop domain-containing protein n=1 Tax=Maribacter caenipelagi TaxID=1447781 RepID=A0A4V3E0Z6_9FLAO|nr:P-loop NTPase fold protein [Maribacter caenipelagi]TDS10866.1 KAP-like P-loop domain-containing protein [Maribacter caenipelagi]